MQFPDHRFQAVQESRFALPDHFRRCVCPRRPRQSLSNSIKWGNSRYYRTPGLKLPNYAQTNGHDDEDDTDDDDREDEEAHVHYDAVVNRVSRWTAGSRAGLTPAGTFAVFALIRSFRLSWLPEGALCSIPQTPASPFPLSPTCEFSAPFGANSPIGPSDQRDLFYGLKFNERNACLPV